MLWNELIRVCPVENPAAVHRFASEPCSMIHDLGEIWHRTPLGQGGFNLRQEDRPQRLSQCCLGQWLHTLLQAPPGRTRACDMLNGISSGTQMPMR